MVRSLPCQDDFFAHFAKSWLEKACQNLIATVKYLSERVTGQDQ